MVVEVTITDHAAAKCCKLLARAAQGHGLRVSVVEGGGSGFEYKLEIGCAETQDQVFEKNGARVSRSGVKNHQLEDQGD